MSVLIGGWGERAIELLERAAMREGGKLDRVGTAGVIGVAGATEGRWRCWMSGRMTNADLVCRRFDGPGPGDLNASIARAHAQMGPAALDLLRGTFVLIAVDLARDIAFVSRDHLGGRPLVYARLGNGALFAEHECAILDLLPSTPGPHRVAVQHWIERGTIPLGHTLYDGIRQVPPAHRLVLSSGGIGLERYWAPCFRGTVSGSAQEISERVREEAFAAVDRAASGSHRPAVRLSGGLDSACVAAGLAARRPTQRRTLAFSALFPAHPETDEHDLIEATARHTGLEVKATSFDDRASILSPALRHITRWRLPPMTPNRYVWEPMMADARRLGVDAMLDGEGGDELFGLAPYLIADMLSTGRVFKAWSLTGGIPGIKDHPDRWVRMRVLRVYGLGGLVPAGARRWRGRRTAARKPRSLLAREDLLTLAELDDGSRGRELGGPRWWGALAEELTGGGDGLGVSGHLRREAVSDGVDRRHPFLFDLDLVDSVLANPPQFQFDPTRDRALLRDGLEGYIPDQVRKRHAKSHFTPPLLAMLTGFEGDLLIEALARPDAPIRSFLCPESLDRLLKRDGPSWPQAMLRLWQIGIVDTWLRANERPEYLSELLERAATGSGKAG